MHLNIPRRNRLITGLGIMAAASGAGALGAAPAMAAAPNPTVTHVVCPANLHVGVAATCGVSVSDVGSPSQGAPTGTVTLQTNQGTNTGTITTANNTGNPAICVLTPVDSRTSRCSFTYTPTSNTGATRIYANYGGDGTLQACFGFTDVTVYP
ncbi:MAG: hypothetical protein QOE27_2064 [Solirubrobacteraceae bacterium]|nr:hypothetical protein [Solirubrobacteraceae bacterium]